MLMASEFMSQSLSVGRRFSQGREGEEEAVFPTLLSVATSLSLRRCLPPLHCYPRKEPRSQTNEQGDGNKKTRTCKNICH